MKVQVQKISFYQLPQAIEMSYNKDQDLLDKYHVAKWDSVKGAVSSTMIMIHACSKIKELSYYKLLYQRNCIGYIVTFENFLYSFGLGIKYRTDEIKKQFWGEVKKLLGEQFACSLYLNNIRAIKFLEKMNMKVGYVDDENHMVTLVNNIIHN